MTISSPKAALRWYEALAPAAQIEAYTTYFPENKQKK